MWRDKNRPNKKVLVLTLLSTAMKSVHTKPWQFFLKIWGKLSPFCGTTDTPVLDFCEHLFWVLKPDWALGGGLHVTNYLGFISGATPADLLVVSMAVKPFSATYFWAGIGRVQSWDLSCLYSQCETRQATLYRLSYSGSPKTFTLVFIERIPFCLRLH